MTGYVEFKDPSQGTGVYTITTPPTLLSFSGSIADSMFTFAFECAVALADGQFTAKCSGTTVSKV